MHTPETATIMVIDDTPANLSFVSRMLESQGHHVVAFPSGELAIRAARRHAPDLILLDIRMQGLDGYTVCACLKADETLSDIPVLFMSALENTEDKVRAFAVGGVDYIPKPFHVEEFQARVTTHLNLRRAQTALQASNHHLEEQIQEKVREISEAQMATIFALSNLVESRDHDSGRHVERTQAYCHTLALALRNDPRYAEEVDDTFIWNLSMAAPLHDIGKVGIPDAILLKPAGLTPDEFEIMKTHVSAGADALQSVLTRYPGNDFIATGIRIARYHHEKWDGSGYLAGLTATSIPLEARIIALADVYDALRSSRPYKSETSHTHSRDIILEGKGTHFDPGIVDAFLSVESRFEEIAGWNDASSSTGMGI